MEIHNDQLLIQNMDYRVSLRRTKGTGPEALFPIQIVELTLLLTNVCNNHCM
jgi:hypothetical protein